MVELSLFSIFLNLIVCSFLTIFLIVRNNEYRSFTIFNVNLIIWSIFYALASTSKDYDLALFYNRICSSFIALIPCLALQVCADFSGKKLPKYISLANILSAALIIILMNTPLMIKGVRPLLDFTFVPDIRPLYLLLPIYYAITVVYGHVMLYKNLKNNTRNKFIFYGFVMGFLGGTTNLFPYMGIPVYPLGNFLVGFYALFITYAIIKHRLFDASLVMSLGIAKVLAFVALGVLYFCLHYFYYFLIFNKTLLAANIFSVIYFIIACEAYHVLVKKFQNIQDKILNKKPYKYEEVLVKLNKGLSNMILVENLTKMLNSIFNSHIKLKINSIYIESNWLLDKGGSKLLLQNVYGDVVDVDLLIELEKIITSIKLPIAYGESADDLRKIFNKTKSSCLVPFISGSELTGFMLISGRGKKHYFSYDDLNLLDNLSIQIGISLERIRLHNKSIEQEKVISEEKAKMLKSLAGSIAHEMRNPLGAIRLAISNSSSFLDSTIKKIGSAAEISLKKEELEAISENYEISLNSIKRANEIINITLNELKGEEPNVENFTYLDAYETVSRSVKEYGYKDEGEKSKIINNFTESDKFIFKGDETLFIYILFNLFKNALYYLQMNPDSVVSVGRQDDEKYNAIYVHDTGPGIKPEVLKNLFGDFVTSGKKDGTGLGLAFCKRTIKAFGGDIKCESELGKYTKFIIYLPKLNNEDLEKAKKSIEEKSKNKSEKSTNQISKKILMIDDQKVNLMVSKKLVENNIKNVTFDTLEDSRQASKLVQENDYDLILMDIQMPEIDGYKTTEDIRRFNMKVPIVAYTSRKSINAKKDAVSSGMTSYLAKPMGNEFFLRSIAKWLLIDYYGKETEEKAIENLKGKTILLVDDELVNRKITTKFLTKYGINVFEASNGKEALDLVVSNYAKYDLILSDINMPVMDGVELVKNIRKFEFDIGEEEMRHIPVVAITGDFEENFIYNLLISGFNDYLTKGGDYANILKMLNLLISIREEEFYLLSNLNIQELSKLKERVVARHVETIEDFSKFSFINLDKLSYFDSKEKNELISSFLQDAKTLIDKIKNDKNANDVANFFFHSHALKGICGNIGADRLFKYTIHINQFGRENIFPTGENWAEVLGVIFDDTKKAFEEAGLVDYTK